MKTTKSAFSTNIWKPGQCLEVHSLIPARVIVDGTQSRGQASKLASRATLNIHDKENSDQQDFNSLLRQRISEYVRLRTGLKGENSTEDIVFEKDTARNIVELSCCELQWTAREDKTDGRETLNRKRFRDPQTEEESFQSVKWTVPKSTVYKNRLYTKIEYLNSAWKEERQNKVGRTLDANTFDLDHTGRVRNLD